jgi:hypothetical protein
MELKLKIAGQRDTDSSNEYIILDFGLYASRPCPPAFFMKTHIKPG